MAAGSLSKTKHANEYLAKHQLAAPAVSRAPSRDLALIVVIPCRDEPDLTHTLASLWRCARPECGVEVLVVFNDSEDDLPRVRASNAATLALAKNWIAGHDDPRLRFHVLAFSRLPRKHAGVGLARKLGMDEAVARLAAAGNASGVLVSLDADCTVASNYLTAIHAQFRDHPRCHAANLYFEHPLDRAGSLAEGIAQYELHLRYYVHALRYAGFPFAHHTVGSCFAVRSDCYTAQGGMNRRKAGEDFYFLQKLMPLGEFGVVTATAVFPSPRESTRVPFGTGRAMERWRSSGGADLHTYAPRVFADLEPLLSNVGRLWDSADTAQALPLSPALAAFLDDQGFAARLAEIRDNTASFDSFRRRFLRWFNAFRAMKFVRWASRDHYAEVCVREAAATMLQWLGEAGAGHTDSRVLLEIYRERDRLNLWPDQKQA